MAFAGVANQIHELRTVAELHNQPGEEIIAELGRKCTAQFNSAYHRSAGILPVIIPAHNEAEDLPATLAAMARTEAFPIVVDNHSTDATATIARKMGAKVISAPTGRKMAATQAGISFAQNELGAGRVLFTDADTLVATNWPIAMAATLEATDEGKGAGVFGTAATYQSGSWSVDVLKNVSTAAGIVRRKVRQQPPLARGHNYALSFDPEGKMYAGIMNLDPELFIPPQGLADDAAIADTVYNAGATLKGTIEPATWVLTKGDRISSVGQILAMSILRRPYEQVALSSYTYQYGELG